MEQPGHELERAGVPGPKAEARPALPQCWLDVKDSSAVKLEAGFVELMNMLACSLNCEENEETSHGLGKYICKAYIC